MTRRRKKKKKAAGPKRKPVWHGAKDGNRPQPNPKGVAQFAEASKLFSIYANVYNAQTKSPAAQLALPREDSLRAKAAIDEAVDLVVHTIEGLTYRDSNKRDQVRGTLKMLTEMATALFYQFDIFAAMFRDKYLLHFVYIKWKHHIEGRPVLSLQKDTLLALMMQDADTDCRPCLPWKTFSIEVPPGMFPLPHPETDHFTCVHLSEATMEDGTFVYYSAIDTSSGLDAGRGMILAYGGPQGFQTSQYKFWHALQNILAGLSALLRKDPDLFVLEPSPKRKPCEKFDRPHRVVPQRFVIGPSLFGDSVPRPPPQGDGPERNYTKEHWSRAGGWANQRYGPGLSKVKRVFRPAVPVNRNPKLLKGNK